MAYKVELRALMRDLQRAQSSAGKHFPRCITTTAVAERPDEPYLPERNFPPSSPATSSRRQALAHAKPFSDFLTDTFNRQHDYLRISVTERCNLRCLYCMPEEGVQLSPNKDLLTTAEIYYLSALFVNQGVSKIRLTGGEPTVRKDIVPLMQQIGSLRRNGLKELALTTNGITLHRKLDRLAEAGLTGVNISLDTLDPFQFQLLTRRQGFESVMKSVNRVIDMNKLGAGIKLKINCVVMRGLNDHQILPFVEMTRDQESEVRFIEYMPFDGNKWSQNKMMPYAEMLDVIRARYPTLVRSKGAKNDTSKTWHIPGFKGRIGFITSMTHNFCGTCNRLRITSDGNLKVCLHGNAEVSLRDLLRKDHNQEPLDEEAFETLRRLELDRRKRPELRFDGEESWMSKEQQLLEIIGAAVKRKKAKHAGMGELKHMKNRPMILIDERPKPDAPSNTIFASPWLNSQSRYLVRPGPSIHLLDRVSPAFSQARCYSSGAKDSESQSKSADALASAFGFQSLSGLFPESIPRGGRYSSPRRQAEDDDAVMHKTGSSKQAKSESQLDSGFFGSTSPTTLPLDSGHHRHELHDIQTEHTLHSMKSNVSSNNEIQEDNAHNEAPKLTREAPLTDQLIRKVEAPFELYRRARAMELHWHRASSLRRRNLSDQSSADSFKRSEGPTQTRQEDSRLLDLTVAPASTASPVDLRMRKHFRRAKSADNVQARNAPSKQSDKFSGRSHQLTHVKSSGEAHMVDVGAKSSSKRAAIAFGYVRFTNRDPFRVISENSNKKGDVLAVARIAGIMAAKRTSDLIPLCHPLNLTKVQVDVNLQPPGVGGEGLGLENSHGAVTIQAHVECTGPTGVEMEALTAVTGSALTVFDMCKAVDPNMIIASAMVVYKSGGKTGLFLRRDWDSYVRGAFGQGFFAERGLEDTGVSEEAAKISSSES